MMKKKSNLSETKISVSVNYLRYCEWLNSRASWIMKQFLCIVPPLVFLSPHFLIEPYYNLLPVFNSLLFQVYLKSLSSLLRQILVRV